MYDYRKGRGNWSASHVNACNRGRRFLPISENTSSNEEILKAQRGLQSSCPLLNSFYNSIDIQYVQNTSIRLIIVLLILIKHSVVGSSLIRFNDNRSSAGCCTPIFFFYRQEFLSVTFRKTSWLLNRHIESVTLNGRFVVLWPGWMAESACFRLI